MITTTPNELFALIKANIESFLESEPSDFEYKPYLWVFEDNNELEADTCEAGDEPFEGMYEYDDLTCTDSKTDKIIPDADKIWKIVDKWFPRKHPEVANYKFPTVLTEDIIIDLCNHFRDAIADGDMRGAPDINIRYSVGDIQFYIARLGDFFFYEDKMYVFDTKPAWEYLHEPKAVIGAFGRELPHRGFAHKVAFCGIQTPFIDHDGQPIFTGDICNIYPEDNWTNERNYHVVSANTYEGYGFPMDNCMLLLQDLPEPPKRVGTIFYKLSFDKIKNTWEAAEDISTMWGNNPDLQKYLEWGKITPNFDQDDMSYLVVSAITGQFDWNIPFPKEQSYPYFGRSSKRVSSDKINTLQDNEIFVFGSNKQGAHGGGAARYAVEHFGAEWGVGEGLTGQCYALPTMEGDASFRQAVKDFFDCAKQHPQKHFLVTAVGCGIAGYSVEQVAPWFAHAVNHPNVYLPKSFWKVIKEKYPYIN